MIRGSLSDLIVRVLRERQEGRVSARERSAGVVCEGACRFSDIKKTRAFPGGAVVENLPANAGDTGSSPGLGGSHMPRSGWAREP